MWAFRQLSSSTNEACRPLPYAGEKQCGPTHIRALTLKSSSRGCEASAFSGVFIQHEADALSALRFAGRGGVKRVAAGLVLSNSFFAEKRENARNRIAADGASICR